MYPFRLLTSQISVVVTHKHYYLCLSGKYADQISTLLVVKMLVVISDCEQEIRHTKQTTKIFYLNSNAKIVDCRE